MSTHTCRACGGNVGRRPGALSIILPLACAVGAWSLRALGAPTADEASLLDLIALAAVGLYLPLSVLSAWAWAPHRCRYCGADQARLPGGAEGRAVTRPS